MNENILEQPPILVVDDNPNNVQLLFDCLTESGFKVLVARSGKSALDKVAYSPPELILLDVLMPEMDGFETCQRLKASALTKDIPVIFMTALTDTENKVKGFNTGAVDYITKPIQYEEVLARVKTHLSICQLQKQLQQQNQLLQTGITERETLALELEKRVLERTTELTQANEKLELEVKERHQAELTLQRSLLQLQQAQAQLVQSEKMSALGQLIAGVAHEINNPVNFIYGNVSHVSTCTSDLVDLIRLYERTYPNGSPEILEKVEEIDLEFLIEDVPKMLSSMQIGAERIRDIVLSLRRFSRQDGLQMSLTNIHEALDTTLLILHNRIKESAKHPSVKIVKDYCPTLPEISCYSGEVNQVFMNILANALDAIEESNTSRTREQIESDPSWIQIHTEVVGNNRIAIHIADSGSGMNTEVSEHLFDPFFTTKSVGKGTGIGLSISWQIIVDKHKGDIRCHSHLGQGTEFVIELPTEPEVNPLVPELRSYSTASPTSSVNSPLISHT